MRAKTTVVGSRTKALAFAACLTMTTGLVTAVPTAAAAAPVTPLCLAVKSISDEQARNDQMNLATAQLRQAGKGQGEVDAYLKRNYGLIKVSKNISSAIDVGTMSWPSAINLPSPSIYQDSCFGRYTAFATWSWKSLSHIRDETFCSFQYTCNIGGNEAFGMAFSRHVSDPGSWSLTTWGATSHYPASTSRAWSVDGNSDGVAFRGQDTFKANGACCSKDYSFYNGQLVFSIDSPGCGSLTAFSKYGHTWDGAGIDSLSISPNSVSIGISNRAYGWDLASQPSNTVYPC